MITLKPVLPSDPEKTVLDRINRATFPDYERAELDELYGSDPHGMLDILAICEEDLPVGFFAVRKFENLRYMAFFAVDAAKRNQGLGSRALTLLHRHYPGCSIVLEFETPDDSAADNPIRLRRRDFYLRNGFFDTGWHLSYDQMELTVACSGEAFDKPAFERFLFWLHSMISDSVPPLYRKDRWIIDAHLHLPVSEGGLQKQKEKLLFDLAQNGVDACVVIADSEQESTIGNTRECAALFSDTPNVFVVGGISPLIDYTAQLSLCETLLQEKKIIALKLFTGHEAFFLSDERLEPVWALAKKYDVPVLFHSGWDNSHWGSAAEAETVLRRHPDVSLCCCHLFYPRLEDCLPLLDYPNFSVDLSSVADEPSRWDTVRTQVMRCIEKAPDRVLFGSDYTACDQKSHLEFVMSLPLSDEKREKLLWKNAVRLYRLPV